MRTLNFEFCSNAQEEMYRNSAFHQQVRQTVHSYKLQEWCSGLALANSRHGTATQRHLGRLPTRGASKAVHELQCRNHVLADENVIGRDQTGPAEIFGRLPISQARFQERFNNH